MELIKKGCEQNSKNFYNEFYSMYTTDDRFKIYIDNLGKRIECE
jgi:hypothetical protein